MKDTQVFSGDPEPVGPTFGDFLDINRLLHLS